jgi:flavodoxin
MTKALIIYISMHHGNTKKVAEVIAVSLAADLLQVGEADAGMLGQYDLIGFGSGVYFGKHHRTLLDFVDTLPVLTNKKAFVFSTSGLRRIRVVHDFSKPLRTRLQHKGFNIVGEFFCRGLDTFGATMIVGGINRDRPNEEDLKRAEDFARALRARSNSGRNVKDYQSFQ